MLVKLIVKQSDLAAFHQSTHFRQFYEGFLLQLNTIARQPAPDAIQDNSIRVIDLIDKCSLALKEFPRGSGSKTDPTSTHHRFGHLEYRTYYKHIWTSVEGWTSDWSVQDLQLVIPYFLHSFGNQERIDYGTGHELNFMVFMYGLYKLGFLELKSDLIVVFNAYIHWMRKIQLQYWLEPAGSHGVWGLDDYQFLPFLFGSAQLIGHQYIRPKDITSPELTEQYSKDYMFFQCCKFIYDVKGSDDGHALSWHSPLLYDISQITPRKDGKQILGCRSGWDRVNEGLVKMYYGECLNKLPIMQHFLFGRFFGLIGKNDSKCTDVDWQRVSSYFDPGTEEFSLGDMQHYYDLLNDSSHREEQIVYKIAELGVEEDVEKETIVKYVQGPGGKQVPIYGKLASARDGCSHVHGVDTELVDTFAMGQAFPTCCNMRMPSAIGSNSRIPFD